MSIDEAIAHALEVAELNEKRLDKEGNPYYEKCEKCAAEHRQLAEWLKELKQLKEQESCEDAVSRKVVVEYIKNSDAELGHDSENELVVEDILTMPSVKPVACIATVKFSKEDIQELVNEKMKDIVVERKKGKWIYDKTIQNWRCSECNETPKTLGFVGTADFMVEHFRFCNHCGAEMEVEK